jgi:hypothetical protein
LRNTAIRSSRKTKMPEKKYLLTLRSDLWNEIETLALQNDVSVAHFLREAAKRNISVYKKCAVL